MKSLSSLPQIVISLAVGLLVGGLLGQPLAFVGISLFTCLLLWRRQLLKLSDWVAHPESQPPQLVPEWAGIVAELDSRQRASSAREHELQESLRFFQGAFSSMRDGVLILDWEGVIRWCNDAAGGLLGVNCPADAGKNIAEQVSSPDFLRYLEAGDYEQPLQFKINHARGLALHVTITRFGEGNRLLFFRNITGRARIDEVRRDFVGNVSHELRTPLTVITGYLDTFLGQRETLSPLLIRPMEQMLQQANRMETLLKDLLWLSRIESEEVEAKRESVDVVALIDELRDEIRGTEPGRRIITRISTDARVSGDYRELYSAVSNLVQNAMKYSAPDTPVTIAWRIGVGGYHLSIADQGLGIEEKHIPRLTERFYRVDDSRSSATGGTGLGLAIVKHVAASHGAQLQIESEYGRGSTFSLVFPLSRLQVDRGVLASEVSS